MPATGLDAVSAVPAPAAPPLGRVLLWRALPLALAGAVLGAALAGWVARKRHAADADGALQTARLARYLGHLPQLSDEQALTVLRGQLPLRDLTLHVSDGEGRALLGPPAPASATAAAVSWTVPRRDAPPWTVTLTPAPASPWAGVAAAAAAVMALLAAGAAVLLLAVQVQLRRTLAPLQALAQAVGSARQRGPTALVALTAQPVREVEGLAQALRELGTAQQQAERGLRLRLQRLLAAQEQQGGVLARHLHDSVEPRLTAARVDLAWLQRRLQANPAFPPVLDGLLAQIMAVQRLLRDHAQRLQPLADPPVAGVEPLRERLQELTDTWSTGGSHLQCELAFGTSGALREVALPPPLLLAVYRMSEAACRLAAHDAAASRLRLEMQIDARAGLLLWAAEDDGRGALTGPPRDGPQAQWLASLEAIAWAWGGELHAQEGAGGRGLRLTARLPLPAAAVADTG